MSMFEWIRQRFSTPLPANPQSEARARLETDIVDVIRSAGSRPDRRELESRFGAILGRHAGDGARLSEATAALAIGPRELTSRDLADLTPEAARMVAGDQAVAFERARRRIAGAVPPETLSAAHQAFEMQRLQGLCSTLTEANLPNASNLPEFENGTCRTR